ncbi:4'-phosphopantetheinyl transferase family protein [Photorhabdus sp. RM323S]|uniref:4'-phosphopantetheinyl transferase family protein n=1 Tax=Photorhabdus sp. RM323S TaxID=3342828 RepID=UPI0036D85DD8
MRNISLSSDFFDLWIIKIDDIDLVSIEQLVYGSDITRHNQICLADRRKKFIFRRVALRYVLNQYLSDYEIITNDNGKPYISTEKDFKYYFSLSASGDYCVIGLSSREMGVDIEVTPSKIKISEIVEYFIKDEKLEYMKGIMLKQSLGLSPGFKNYYCLISLYYWVRLEAYIKLFSSTLHEELLVNSAVSVKNMRELEESTLLIHNQEFVCALSQKKIIPTPNIKRRNYSEIIRNKDG